MSNIFKILGLENHEELKSKADRARKIRAKNLCLTQDDRDLLSSGEGLSKLSVEKLDSWES